MHKIIAHDIAAARVRHGSGIPGFDGFAEFGQHYVPSARRSQTQQRQVRRAVHQRDQTTSLDRTPLHIWPYAHWQIVPNGENLGANISVTQR